ncbi:uncharacterized protein LOC131854803 [Achroia grisella]|uniref:uncharacterized protein LOC131854803 n=1 Tax=Achroia grisella TaxID=688607 RepID=UPI0027D2C7EE|nr:uncharacterized protein LOC131854803 [Achroia grisella]
MMKMKGIKSKLKKDGEFIPPDGGWGWIIIFAAGISNLSTLPILQQFGLLCRDKLARLGIASSETTTILNINFAMASCAGLVNGPMFKTFSYRQVSLAGAIIVFISLMFTTFSYNFITYLIFFSILYGFGYGISSSANALALNTYWKNRRRLATGLSWTITGLGPVIWPHIVTGLFTIYGETGTILIISGLSLHAIACALFLHPVEWHSKKPVPNEKENKNFEIDEEKSQHKCKTDLDSKDLKESGYYSTFFKNEENPSSDVIHSKSLCVSNNLELRNSTSSLSSINTSIKKSKNCSITNIVEKLSRKSSLHLNESKSNSSVSLETGSDEKDKYSSKLKRNASLKLKIPESEIEDLISPQYSKIYTEVIIETKADKSKGIANGSEKYINSFKLNNQHEEQYSQDAYDKNCLKETPSNQLYDTGHGEISNTFNKDNEVLNQASTKLQSLKDNKNNDEEENIDDREFTFCEKIYVYFDLDLLKDFTYINLMLGITLSNFNELNFSVLTPFILGDHGYSKVEVAYYMSLLAGIDLSVRFCIPFIAGKIEWDNNTFYLIGITFMAIGRIVLAHFDSYHAVLFVAVIVGFGKGMRTVFMALVLPTHVPLHKLPGATGLQLLTAGIVYLTLGPVVGWIKDNTSTAVTLHCLNIFTWMTILSWSLEKYFRKRKQRADATTDSGST